MGPSRISKESRKLLFTCFVQDTNAKQAAKISDVSRQCANRYFRHWREEIYKHLRHAPRFSGEVEVDLGFFGGRNSKKASDLVRRLAGLPSVLIARKRKFNRKEEKKRMYYMGFLQRGGDIYTHPIKRKDRLALESVIRMVVEKGSTIYSDKEPALSQLKFDGYKHESVNHSVGYTDPRGLHINGIESFFRESRAAMGKRFKGVSKTTLMLHIKEREFRYNHRDDLEKALKSLLKGI